MLNRRSLKRPAYLAGVYVAGLLAGFVLWDHITLPYDNPWGIVGLPSLAHYHPGNNIVRFLVLVLCPTLLLVAVYLLGPKRFREIAFPEPARVVSEVPELEEKGRKGFYTVLLAGLAVLAALNIPTYHAWGELNRFHEGESLGTSVSYLAGQVPYQDYLFVHGIYQDPLRSVIAFRLFGRSIASARMLESLLKIAAFALLALVLVELFRPQLWAACGALLVIVALHGLVQLEALWLPLAPLRIMQRDVTAMAFLVAVLWLFRAVQQGRPGSAAIAAFLTAFIPLACFGYSIDRGFYLTATAVVTWAALWISSGRRAALGRWFWLAIVMGAALAVALVGYLLHWTFGAFLTFTFQVMPRYKEWMDGIPFPIGQAPMWGFCALAAANLYVLGVRFLEEHRRAGARVRIALEQFVSKFFLELCLFFMAIFFFRSGLGRADLVHVSVNSWPLYVLSLALFSRPWRSRFPALLKTGVIVAAVVLAGLCFFRLQRSSLIAENFPVGKPDAVYVPPSYVAAARFLRETLGPGESFFTLTSEAIWYYLVDKPCPSRFSVVWFAAPFFYQEEIIDALKKNEVKFVLYRNQAPSNRIDGITSEQRLPILSEYVRESYTFFRNIEGHEIWVKSEKDKKKGRAEARPL